MTSLLQSSPQLLMLYHLPSPHTDSAYRYFLMRQALSAFMLTLLVLGVKEYFCFWYLEGKEVHVFDQSYVYIFVWF